VRSPIQSVTIVMSPRPLPLCSSLSMKCQVSKPGLKVSPLSCVNAPVWYPASRSASGSITSLSSGTWPCWSTPCTDGYMEVRIEVCEGAVFGAWEYAVVKFTPRAASASMAGEVARG